MDDRWVMGFVLVLAAGLTGCLGDDASAPSEDPDPADVDRDAGPTVYSDPCSSCLEPTVAVDDEGRVFVVEGQADEIVVFQPGNATPTYENLPPLPSDVPEGVPGDETVTIGPEGHLWFTRLYRPSLNHPTEHGAAGGLQVARSDDGGETWTVNHYFGLPEDLQHPSDLGDRQWLAFGENGTVHLTYHHASLTAEWVATSRDRGETFEPLRPITFVGQKTHVNPPGSPAVTTDGTLVVPYAEDLSARPTLGGSATDNLRTTRLSVALSTGPQGTFEEVTVYRSSPVPEGAGLPAGGLPHVTAGGENRVYTAWRTASGEVLASVSIDGARTWSKATSVTGGEGNAIRHPWLEAHGNGTVSLVWYRSDGSDESVRYARLEVTDGGPSLAKGATAVVEEIAHPSTDFPHFDLGPAGVPHVVWTNGTANRVRALPPG